jgi:ribonuclease-3 family protein
MSDNLIMDEKNSLDSRLLSPAALAFLGDAVYELVVREYLIKKGGMTPCQLHEKAVGFVRAAAQAGAVRDLLPALTPEERDVLRRGRNANSSRVPRSANPLEYRHATGFEALLGYLYLRGEHKRILEFFSIIAQGAEIDSGGETTI